MLARLSMVLIMCCGTLAAAEPMTETHNSELRSTLSALIQRIWHAYQDGNAIAHNALLTSDSSAVHPDGSLHLRPPTKEEILAGPLAAFSLTNLQVAQLTPDTALVNYLADVTALPAASNVHVRYQVGEVWVKKGGEWKRRYYQPTVLPSPAASPSGSSGR